jgi:Rps23 Pro-64 3,4-dihydroxylase Tpa1-like proline 4-hydroxylase
MSLCVIRLFDLNPRVDAQNHAARFARDGRVQVRDVLTAETAANVRTILARHTEWGIAWQAGSNGPNLLRSAELREIPPARQREMIEAIHATARQGDYAVRFTQYPMLNAYLGKWAPGSPHDLLLEHINDQPFLDLVRTVTGIPELVKADAQATLFGPGDFLSLHTDSHVAEGWRVAYVLNFAIDDWKPDWGGYLNFLNDDGDVIEGWRPRFNALNLIRVPQPHQVTYVPPFAPLGRYAITGWFRDH